MDRLDDAELLRRYAEDHSEAAFSELARRHLNLIYRSALRQTGGDTHRAEDITQAVLTQLARKAGSLVRHPRLPGWLYTATHLITLAHLRAERRRQLREHEAHLMHENSFDPPGENWERVSPLIDEAIRGLAAIDRGAIILHYFEGRPFAEVGDRLALREDAARMRVARALEKLRTSLARRGIASTSAALGVMLTTESAHAVPANLLASAAQIGTASAGAGAASFVTIFQIMSTSKLALAVAAVLALFAAGLGVNYARQIQAANASVAAWNGRTAAAETKLNAIEGRQKKTQMGKTPASNPAAVAAPALSPEQISQELELQRLRDRQRVAQFVLQYGPLMKSLGLTPEQIQLLVAGNLKAVADFRDLQMTARLAGADLQSDPVLKEMAEEMIAAWSKQAANIAGGANLKALQVQQEVDANRMDRSGSNSAQLWQAVYAATQVAGLVFASPTPLTVDQRAQLVQLIVNNSPQTAVNEDASMDTVDWKNVYAQAATTSLTPAQISAMKSWEAETEQWAMEKQVRVAVAANRAP